MFYYPNVLHYRTGCFSTIWLAATKGRKINRRDLLKVNVQRTCNDIMDYVLVRVAPVSEGLPRPRFSLYLSSQLQYGVVLVFHQQCQFLLEEIQESIDRLLRFRKQVQIDMRPEETRQHHVLPDALSLLNETEGARDPFFGSMDFGLPSPSSLIRLAQEIGEVSPERPLPERRVSPPPDGITASQESITLPETEPAAIPEPEFEGAELQEFDMIDMLLEQPEHFPEGEDERAREELERVREREEALKKERERELERERERERERAAAEIERMRELTRSTISLEPVPVTELSIRDEGLEPEEALGLPMEMPELAEREITVITELLPIPPAPPSPEEERRERRRESPRLEPVPISPEAPVERRRRRRQLVFIDEHTQIPQEALQAQINDPLTETRSLENVLIRTPSEERDPKALLSNPCMSLPPEILELWKQSAVIHPIPPAPRREVVREEEPVPEREREREEPAEREMEPELVFREVPREMMESGIAQYDTPVSSLVILETTDREVSPLETPELRRSPVLVSIPGLEDIMEERVPELREITMTPVSRLAAMEEQEVTFHSLLPPVVSRRTVAQAFWRLLEQVDRKKVTVRQDEPYGDIIITQVQQVERQRSDSTFTGR